MSRLPAPSPVERDLPGEVELVIACIESARQSSEHQNERLVANLYAFGFAARTEVHLDVAARYLLRAARMITVTGEDLAPFLRYPLYSPEDYEREAASVRSRGLGFLYEVVRSDLVLFVGRRAA